MAEDRRPGDALPVPGMTVIKPIHPHRRPRLSDLIKGAPDRESHGPRRALIKCHHEDGRRHPIAEVRGEVVVVYGLPNSLERNQAHALRATYDVFLWCSECVPRLRRRVLDLASVRRRLRAWHGRSVLMLDADEVAPRPRDS